MTIGNYWEALLSSSGQRHTFSNRSWNGTIAPGGSVSFGFISVGGEAGRGAVDDAAAAVAFSDSVHALIQRYGVDGVDIDLENGLNPTYMAQALRSLRAKVGAGLVIAMVPQTIDMQNPATSYFKLALDIRIF